MNTLIQFHRIPITRELVYRDVWVERLVLAHQIKKWDTPLPFFNINPTRQNPKALHTTKIQKIFHPSPNRQGKDKWVKFLAVLHQC